MHGTRRAYVAGCRCTRCRASNAAATAACRRDPVGTRDATATRLYLDGLQQLGLGTRQIARLSSTSRATVAAILDQSRTTLRPATAARLQATRPQLARGATIPATKTWRHVDSLTREGFTRRELAARLGLRSQQLQLHRHVTVSTALHVAALYRHLST